MRSLPWSVDYFMLYYNKEIFAKRNIPYPDTIEEMIKAAELLNDPKEGIAGFVGRGLRNANFADVRPASISATASTSSTTRDNLLTDSPEAIEATKQYQYLLTKAGPPRHLPASTGWNPRLRSSRAAPRCGSDGIGSGAAAGRSDTLAWSARSATA